MDAGLNFVTVLDNYATTLVLALLLIIIVKKALNIVPQSEEYIVERLGKYSKTLKSGINVIIPFLETIKHKIIILERRLDEFSISVITRDNVEIKLQTTVFFRINDSAKSVYRIRDVDGAIQTAAESIIRSAAGKLELDEIQSAREKMSIEILENLREASDVWGVEITRTEITDVIVDEATKQSQRQQLNAERERRAAVARAEGEKRSVELAADAKLYEAKKTAEAVKVAADAEAYSIAVEAEATAKQTSLIANAINNDGESAIQFELVKQQVEALAKVSTSENTKTVIIPTDVTKVLGSLDLIMDTVKSKND
jgi:regulator of protease activity HflC (stomatin/prohibitin superfamily)